MCKGSLSTVFKKFAYLPADTYWSEQSIKSGASLGVWIDGFEAFLGDWKLPNFSAIQCHNMSFYWISSKIDGFGRTHRTHADEAPATMDTLVQREGGSYP